MHNAVYELLEQIKNATERTKPQKRISSIKACVACVCCVCSVWPCRHFCEPQYLYAMHYIQKETQLHECSIARFSFFVRAIVPFPNNSRSRSTHEMMLRDFLKKKTFERSASDRQKAHRLCACVCVERARARASERVCWASLEPLRTDTRKLKAATKCVLRWLCVPESGRPDREPMINSRFSCLSSPVPPLHSHTHGTQTVGPVHCCCCRWSTLVHTFSWATMLARWHCRWAHLALQRARHRRACIERRMSSKREFMWIMERFYTFDTGCGRVCSSSSEFIMELWFSLMVLVGPWLNGMSV